MTSSFDDQASFAIDQALFGYDDGHRLLSGSFPLPSRTLSLLLPLSDLASGVDLKRHQWYWTGLPIHDAKMYVLLKTWPAPEMPRPGCVWTHALFVKFEDLARIRDLRSVARLARRPSKGSAAASYSSRLTVTLNSDAKADASAADSIILLTLLRAVYSGKSPAKVAAETGQVEDAVFAIWSQQWPRLRRVFAFRTSASTIDPRTRQIGFWLLTEPLSDPEARPQLDPPVMRPWERVAVQDIQNPVTSDFRRFIWKFGADMQQGRLHFRNLAQWYLKTRTERLSGQTLRTILDELSTLLPALEDGLTFKTHMVCTELDVFPLLPPRDPVSVLKYFADEASLQSMPLPSDQTFEDMWRLWPSHSSDIFALAERAHYHPSGFGRRLIDRLLLTVNRASVLFDTRKFPRLRQELVRADPTLFDTDSLIRLPVTDLLDLLGLLPTNPPLFGRVVTRLHAINNSDLAEAVFHRDPNQTLSTIVDAIEREGTQLGSGPAEAWQSLIAMDPHRFLQNGLVEGTQSTRALLRYASLLAFESDAVVKFGARPWARALRVASDNVTGTDRQLLLGFLMGMALRDPKKGHEPLFETSFDSLHEDIRATRLPLLAYERFASLLPGVKWWQEWDICLRLRLAVVNAYVDHDLDPASFGRLSKRPWVQEELCKVASESKRGRKFLENVK